MIKLTFDFPPVAQARPRATRFGKGIRLYDKEELGDWKKIEPGLAQAIDAMKEEVKDDD